MADYLTNTTDLTKVANAIRTKGGITEPLTYPDEFVTAIEDISGGGGSSFLISMTYDGSSISNVSYNGATATEIAEAVVTDPTTRVVFALNVGSGHGVMYCTPSTIQASYNADWGEIATSIYAVAPMWYSDSGGDEEYYLLMLTYTSEAWYADKRTTI